MFTYLPIAQVDDDLKRFFEYRDIKLYDNGDGRYKLEVTTKPCKYLTANNKCTLHGTDNKPLWCKNGPFNHEMLPAGCEFNQINSYRLADGRWAMPD